MKLRDVFSFRDPPESESSKPFLEHLEDLRWTIVRMAITVVVSMAACFAFRQRLVLVLQRPLYEVGVQAGALRALGITDSITISFHLAFYAGIVLSFPILLYFIAQFVLPALNCGREAFSLPRDRRQLRAFSDRRQLLLLLAAPENDPLFLPRHGVVRLDSDLGRWRNIIPS